MNDTHLRRLLRDVIDADLSTNSGIYAGVDTNLAMRLNERGEYEYVGLDPDYVGDAEKLLRVSAFGGAAPDEDEVARELFGAQLGVEHDTIAGYYVGTFAGWVEDADLRERGSSGGLATWVLSELMRRGEIDGVVHLKPGGPDGQLFTYQISRSVDEVRAGAKTRYYPGELSAALREMREIPGRYAVVGIPSFIYELRLLQLVEPIFKERVVYTIGLICGHQKSANYAAYLAWRGGVQPGTLRSIDFRKKVAGEPANRYSTELTGVVDGLERTRVLPQTELFGTDWGLGFFKSSFSDFTQDALNETADLVLGDAWLPRYTADGRGTNVLLVRDARLSVLLEEGRERGELYLDNVPLEDIIQSQTSLVRQSIIEVPYRFKYLARRGERTPTIRRSGLPTVPSLARRMTQRIRVAMSRRSHTAFVDAAAQGSLATFDRQMMPLVRRYKLTQQTAKLRRLVARGPKSVLHAVIRRVRR